MIPSTACFLSARHRSKRRPRIFFLNLCNLWLSFWVEASPIAVFAIPHVTELNATKASALLHFEKLRFRFMQNLSTTELQLLLNDTAVQLVDVRQSGEWAIGHLPQAQLLPLDQLPDRLHELDVDKLVVFYCHHGVRSEMAGRLTEASGHTRVAHLLGGIDAWSNDIDPGIPRY